MPIKKQLRDKAVLYHDPLRGILLAGADRIELLEQRVHEIDRLRAVVRDCARTLQHNLSMHAIKDEQMMLKSLQAAWDAVGRSFCESTPNDKNQRPEGSA